MGLVINREGLDRCAAEKEFKPDWVEYRASQEEISYECADNKSFKYRNMMNHQKKKRIITILIL